MTIKRIQPYRRIAEALQALIILGLPFIRIKGESALRFDVPTLRLHFFGVSLWMEEFFIVLIALIFWLFLIVLVTLIFGRIWCGWLCPRTVLVDYTSFVDKAPSKGPAFKLLSYGATFIISVIVAASLIWYFVSPYEFFPQLLSGKLGGVTWGFWIVLTGIIFLNLAQVRHRFCSTVCPYARLQSALFDAKTLIIAFDSKRKEECINCIACVKVCPVGIDIREGLNPTCIHCAKCVDACTKKMENKGKNSLIGYSFGLPGETGRVIRQNVILVGSVTLLFLGLLIYLAATRVPLGVTVTPNFRFPPRITNEGGLVNSYILSVENRARDDKRMVIGIEGAKAEVTPRRIMLKAGEGKRFTIYVTMEPEEAKAGRKKGKRYREFEFSLQYIGPDSVKIQKEARFITPEAQ